MLETLISFYHAVLGHAGATRVHKAMAIHFWHTELETRIKTLVTRCNACQLYKRPQYEYGQLPERIVDAQPWSTVAVDCIGPWELKDARTGKKHKFHALTIIDQVTNYCEIIRMQNMTSAHAAMQFENHWLARYPMPNSCIFDQGSEFKGDFREMLDRHGIKPAGIGTKNPQANAICERLHQTIADVLRPLSHTSPPRNPEESANLVDCALATAAYAARTAVHTTLGISPGAMVFNRDMLLDIPLIADF